MRKKLLSILLSVFMVLIMMPTMVLAETISTVGDVFSTYETDFPTGLQSAWINSR